MTTKVIFNTDKKLKEAAMRKARKEGITYTAFLNIVTRAYVNNSIVVNAFERDLEQAREQYRDGKFLTHEQVLRKFKIKSR